MPNCIMYNVKEKLSNVRNSCPGMPEEIYQITDCMSKEVIDVLVPRSLTLLLFFTIDNIKKEKILFTGSTNDFIKNLSKNKSQALEQAKYFIQIIDNIADYEFSQEFRKILKENFDLNPPKISETIYPEYIKASVDWWVNEIVILKLSKHSKAYSEDEINLLKETLANEIINELDTFGRCILNVDYLPCDILAIAGEKIGVDPLTGYPIKNNMIITKKEVKVSHGNCSSYKTIWKSNLS